MHCDYHVSALKVLMLVLSVSHVAVLVQMFASEEVPMDERPLDLATVRALLTHVGRRRGHPCPP